MAESKKNPKPASLDDAIMAAKAAKSAKKAQQKKDQEQTGGKGGAKGYKPPQIGGPQGQAHTKMNVPRMHSQQKKGGG